MPTPTPAAKVEFAFGVDATAIPTAPEWVDVSTDLEGVPSIHSAMREDLLSRRWQAGTCEIVLRNEDGQYDPANTAGPHYGDLVPLVRVRVTFTWATVEYKRFEGFVERWPPVWEYPEDSTVTITAKDGTLVFANFRLPSVWEVSVANAKAWYRHGESSGTVARDSANGYHGTYEGGATFNSRASINAYDDTSAIEFQADQRNVIDPTLITSYPFAIEGTFKFPLLDAPFDDRYLVRFTDDSGPTAQSIAIFVQDSGHADAGKLFAGVQSGTTPDSRTGVSAARVDDDDEHHYILAGTSASDITLWLDGVQQARVDTGGTGTPSIVPYTYATIGNTASGSSLGDRPALGTIGDVIIYEEVISSVDAEAQYEAFSAPWDSFTTGGRITQLLELASWPASQRDIDGGISSFAPADTQGRTLLEYLQDIAETEQGSFYVSPTGVATFRDRHAVFLESRHAVSQATFSDNPGAGEHSMGPARSEQSLDLIKNRVRVKRKHGSVYQADDATSQNRYFVRAFPAEDAALELLVDSDSEVTSTGDWILAHFKDPQVRFLEIVVDPADDTDDLLPVLLGLQLEDRITVEVTPPGAAFRSQEVLVEGITIEWPEDVDLIFRLQTSPAETQEYWVLGDADSALGENTRAAF